MVPVVSDDNKIMGVVTEGNLMACLLNGRVQPEDVVESVMYKQFKRVCVCVCVLRENADLITCTNSFRQVRAIGEGLTDGRYLYPISYAQASHEYAHRGSEGCAHAERRRSDPPSIIIAPAAHS